MKRLNRKTLVMESLYACRLIKKWLQHRCFPLNFPKLLRTIIFRSSHPAVFLRKVVLKICSKFTGEDPYRSVVSIKLQNNFIKITLRHGCFPVNLLHIFKTPFPRNTSGWLLLYLIKHRRACVCVCVFWLCEYFWCYQVKHVFS